MRGIPKRFGTAADVAACVALAMDGDMSAAALASRMRAMLNTGTVYVFDRVLESKTAADGEEPEYRVLESETTSGETEIVQYQLQANPASAYALIGLDAETINQYIAQLEGA